MSKIESIKDMSASVRQKLRNLSKFQNKPFNEVLQFYASQRFLYL